MMCGLPQWLQVLQALLTPTIALAVGLIAFLQWRTAHGRLVLDLFEKRLEVYERVRVAVSVINTTGKTSHESDIALLEAIKASQFLFGQDVRDYLDRMWERFSRLKAANDMMEAATTSDRKRYIEAQTKLFSEITQFYHEGADVFAPYMRMDHRLRRPTRKPRQRPGVQESRAEAP